MKDAAPYKLDQLGTVSRGKSRHRPRNDPRLYGGNWPFFQTGDVKAAESYLRNFSQTYNDFGLAQSKLWPAGTLCITIAANIAETAILGIPGCFPDSIVGFIPDPDKADAKYIKHYIEILKLGMQNASHGTTQDNLSVDKLLTFDFVVPPVRRQREIVSILSAYDDLIENNTRRIAILEEMARRIYEEWFVRFRFPGHEGVRMVASELGLVPEGWQVDTLNNVCAPDDGIQTGPFGSQLHKADYTETGVPVLMPKDLIGFRIDTSSVAYIPEKTADRLARHRMMPGDIVYGRRGDIGRRAFIMEHQKGWLCGTGCLRFRPDPQVINGWYLFNHIGQDNVVGLIQGRAHGVTMPNLNARLLESIPIIRPPRKLQDQFEQFTFPMAELREKFTAKNTNLRATRDLLLPKLISGELDVSNMPDPAHNDALTSGAGLDWPA